MLWETWLCERWIKQTRQNESTKMKVKFNKVEDLPSQGIFLGIRWMLALYAQGKLRRVGQIWLITLGNGVNNISRQLSRSCSASRRTAVSNASSARICWSETGQLQETWPSSPQNTSLKLTKSIGEPNHSHLHIVSQFSWGFGPGGCYIWVDDRFFLNKAVKCRSHCWAVKKNSWLVRRLKSGDTIDFYDAFVYVCMSGMGDIDAAVSVVSRRRGITLH